ncbi:Uncharacterized protein APZ42_029789 [Daphnia magna]|uniref:Uncharacterized protein n=1 Tax=Daphnia magna TaxID=35525 RepID=A0A164PB68_9CRUS|nr:Uncharacterized protein APZ42_029789 [Daphnia magna]
MTRSYYVTPPLSSLLFYHFEFNGLSSQMKCVRILQCFWVLFHFFFLRKIVGPRL